VALKITSREVNGVSVVALDGRIVLGEESNALRERLKSLIAEGKKKIVLNMDIIKYIDSAGLGTLVAAHHLHSAASGICLPGGDPRWVLTQRGGLGSGSDTSGTTHHRGTGASSRAPTARTGPGASLASGISIRSRGICSHPREAAPHGSEHESAGKPLRQCQLRKLHEDAEARRNLHQQVRGPRTFTDEHRRVHRGVLQSAAVALGAGLSFSGRIEQETECQAESRSATMEFFENKENNRKNSKGLLGKGTQMPSPSPDPFSC
jgi:anti-anti-sigma factor